MTASEKHFLPRLVRRVAATLGVLIAAAIAGGVIAGGTAAAFTPWPRGPLATAALTGCLCFLCSGVNAFLSESLVEDAVKSFAVIGVFAIFGIATDMHPVIVTVVIVAAVVAPWPNRVIARMWDR